MHYCFSKFIYLSLNDPLIYNRKSLLEEQSTEISIFQQDHDDDKSNVARVAVIMIVKKHIRK